jgi:hypothetical protein
MLENSPFLPDQNLLIFYSLTGVSLDRLEHAYLYGSPWALDGLNRALNKQRDCITLMFY